MKVYSRALLQLVVLCNFLRWTPWSSFIKLVFDESCPLAFSFQRHKNSWTPGFYASRRALSFIFMLMISGFQQNLQLMTWWRTSFLYKIGCLILIALFLKALNALKKGAQLLKYGRKGKPKFYPFRLSNVSLLPDSLSLGI